MQTSRPEIAVLVSSFERPAHIRRVLASIAAQRGVAGAFEVIVTDDGSRDETPRLVRQFAASATFPVRFITHPHDGFHIARCRNEGVRASTAPYLLFLDGDCMIPPDHLRAHLDCRRESYALAGYPIYLDQSISEQITPPQAQAGSYLRHVSIFQKLEMRWRHLRSQLYTLLNSPTRPKLLGGNLGIARADYQRINGYDENFRGWGCEDDDLRMRLVSSGIRVASIAWWTHTFHLWHPKTPSAPQTWRDGANVEYLHRPLRLARCLAGLTKRRLQDLRIHLAGSSPKSDFLNDTLPLWCRVALASGLHNNEPPDLELAFAGHADSFSNRCDCRLLLVPPGTQPTRRLLRSASLIFSHHALPSVPADRTYKLNSLDSTLQAHLGFPTQSRRATTPLTLRAA
jgi:glycosyltransferase involved in cell wall biosynthesis